MSVYFFDNNPITYSNMPEFAKFLAKNSDYFVLSGGHRSRRSFKLKAESAMNSDKYKKLKPFIFKSEILYPGFKFYFKICAETTEWLEHMENIFTLTEPFYSLIFFKNNEYWAARSEHYEIISIRANDTVIQELDNLHSAALAQIMNFINDFNSSKELSIEQFAEKLSAYPNSFFLNQFYRSFNRKDWGKEIKNFYKTKENMRLMAQVVSYRGVANLTDEELYISSYWLEEEEVDWCNETDRHFDIDISCGGDVILDFFLSVPKNKLFILIEQAFARAIFAYDYVLAKNLVNIFLKLGSDESLIPQSDVLKSAFLDVLEMVQANLYEIAVEFKVGKLNRLFHRYKLKLSEYEVYQDYFYVRYNSKIRRVKRINLKRFVKNNDNNLVKLKLQAYYYYYLAELINKKHLKKAVYLFKILSEKDTDVVECQYDLAKCYLYGIGVKKDLEKAKYWLDKVSEQGIIVTELLSKIQK